MLNNAEQTDTRQQKGAVMETEKKEEVGGTNGTIDQKGGSTVKNLYRVKSKVNGIYRYGCCYDEVTISWFCKDRDRRVIPPQEGIAHYNKLDGWERTASREMLNQLFSAEEAIVLQDYLSRFKQVRETHIIKQDLPLYRIDFLMQQLSSDAFRDVVQPASWDETLPFRVVGDYRLETGAKRQQSVCPTCGTAIDLVIRSAGTPPPDAEAFL